MDGLGIAAALFMCVSPLAFALEPSSVRVRIDVKVDEPAIAGLPIWLHVDVHDGCLEEIYPPGTNPAWFSPAGDYADVRQNGHPVAPFQFPFVDIDYVGPIGDEACPEYPPTGSPIQHRLPLHLAYVLDKPGTYTVQWIVRRPNHAGTMVKLAQSPAVTFTVLPSTPAQREIWLRNTLANRPPDSAVISSEYIPALLAAWRDPRVTRTLIDFLCSPNTRLAQSAAGALEWPIGQDGANYLNQKIAHGCQTVAAKNFASSSRSDATSSQKSPASP